ncbi:hypothetical protein K438DRAFT_854572 [Mycena galopus ATCC 62051]|nr:hypothetical protein K438DRAFT_854572 [Mycena galopus ATCC 62051]
MHDDLEFKHIAKLPLLYRICASNAANGSLSDFRKLHALILKGPPKHTKPLLPVYYRNLDVTGIPTPDQLDSESVAEYASAIERAALALQGLSWSREWWNLGIPKDLAPDLWSRIWNWIDFLDEYRDFVQGIMPFSVKDAYAAYVGILRNYQWHKETAHLPHDTPRVRVVIARAWGIILRQGTIRQIYFHDIMRFLYDDLLLARPHNIQEYVEGSGGTSDEFATLVMDHIERTHAPDGGYPIGEKSAFFLWGPLRLLVEGDDGDGPLSTALLDRGLVRTVTHLLCIYPGSEFEALSTLRFKLFTILVNKLDAFPSYAPVAQSLRSRKLVQAITSCGYSDNTAITDCIRYLLQTVLPRSLVSLCVLSEIQGLHTPGKTLFDDPEPFPDQQLFDAWRQFNHMATLNNEVFQAYYIGGYTSIRGCDNMKCGRLCRRNEIKRCSSCHRVNYCSPTCQAIDWQADGHKLSCARLRTLRRDRNPLTDRERSFLHALIHYRYEKYLLTLCLKKIGVMLAHPGDQSYLMVDFTKAPEIAAVCSARDMPPPDPNPSDGSAAQWADQVARAARSGGRMELIVVLVADGTGHTRRRLAPIRSRTSVLYDGLRRIAANIPAGADPYNLGPDVEQQVQSLVDDRRKSGDDQIEWTINVR